MANPSLQIGNDNWAIKEDNLLGYSTAGTRFVPQPITMTRATLGTRVNPEGLVEDVELLGSELVVNGDFATDSDWSKINATISGGKATITVVSGAYSLIEQSVTYQSGKTYRLTAQVQGTSGKACTFFDNGSNIGGLGTSNGTINFNGSLQDVNITFTSNSNSNKLLVVRNGSGDFSFTIDNISVKEVTIDNLPRVDYTDGTSSLLVEPQSTNSISYSEDFSQWLTVGSPTLTNNYGVSPDGTQNSTRLEMVVSDRIYIATSLSGDITFSVYLKGTGSIRLRDNTNVYIEDVVLTSEWVRYELVFNSTITSVQIQQVSGTSDLQIWGAQCENLSYPTSYIPTSGSTVTRNQETYTKTGISDKINSEEGVLFVEMAAFIDNNDGSKSISLSSGGYSDNIIIQYTTNTNQIVFKTSPSYSTSIFQSFTVSDITQDSKMAFKYKLNDCSFWHNGIKLGSVSSFTPFSVGTLNVLNFNRGDGGEIFEGKIKQLQVFKTALSDSELATLTQV